MYSRLTQAQANALFDQASEANTLACRFGLRLAQQLVFNIQGRFHGAIIRNAGMLIGGVVVLSDVSASGGSVR